MRIKNRDVRRVLQQAKQSLPQTVGLGLKIPSTQQDIRGQSHSRAASHAGHDARFLGFWCQGAYLVLIKNGCRKPFSAPQRKDGVQTVKGQMKADPERHAWNLRRNRRVEDTGRWEWPARTLVRDV